MTGVQIEYFLGLYFLVTSISESNGKISADLVRIVFAIIFLVAAIFLKYSPV